MVFASTIIFQILHGKNDWHSATLFPVIGLNGDQGLCDCEASNVIPDTLTRYP